MRASAVIVVMSMLLVVRSAHGDDAAVNGFVTTASGELRGTVTSPDGKPMANAVVHLAPANGPRRQVRTDNRGAYRAQIGGGETHVFIDGPGRVVGSVVAGEDVIEVREVTPPAVAAKPKRKPGAIPDYTDAAIDADVWARAWLMLHVDERGGVSHVKVVNDPGYGLAEAAVRHAFALKFEPALDRSRRPTRSLVLWTYEWPAHSWMTGSNYSMTLLPEEVAMVHCRAPGRKRALERDCSKPDVAGAAKRPWIARRKP